MEGTPIDVVLSHLKQVKPAGDNKWKALCPAHEDHSPSLGITEGNAGTVLLKCWSHNCSAQAIVDALGLKIADLFPKTKTDGGDRAAHKPRVHQGTSSTLGPMVATYDYTDAAGVVLYQVCRFDQPKTFRQRRPEGKSGWAWGLGGVKPVLYRLNELSRAPDGVPVIVVEGEKDADRLAGLGVVATSSPMGAGKWAHTDDSPLAGRDVIIIPDNDQVGHNHALDVACSLTGKAKRIKIVELTGLAEHGDVSDWLDAGGELPKLIEIIKQAKQYQAPPEPTAPRQVEVKGFAPGVFHLTDEGNALRLIDLHGKDLHYCVPWGRWLIWDDRRWCPDDTLEIGRRATEVVNMIHAEAAAAEGDERQKISKWAYKSEGARMVANMIVLARSKRPILPEALDTDPWLLGVNNGTVNLRTGELQEHRREDLITMQADVTYDADAKCLRWLKFMDEIMASDIDLVRYLQQIVGICLTGDITEQILPIFYGQGRNGKSTFLDTITGLMGDYAGKAPPGLLTAKQHDQHPTEIADLAGKRLIVASETEEGKRLRIQLVKEMTGDATLKGRKMRQDFFEFPRTNKILLVTNNKPVVREPKDAIWRRIQLVPFTVQFAGEQEDRGLLATLQAERPGILLWAIEGCLAWQRDGLLLADEVKMATAAYKDEQNFLEEFFTDRCIRGLGYTCSRKQMWQAYQEWAKAVGERRPLARNAFYERIGSLDGVEEMQLSEGGKRTRGWRGINVLPKDPSYEPDDAGM